MFSELAVSGGTGLHKGDREYQQDQVGLWQHPKGKPCFLAMVADGMGGRSGGRKASDQVLMTAQQLFERFSPESDDPTMLLMQMVQEAHTVIRLTAVSSEQEPHSTIAAFLVLPDGTCNWIHCGDSRIYHVRNGQVMRRTSDDSYVQSLVDKGLLAPEQAQNHPQSNVLIGCLGTESTPVPHVETISSLQAGDTFMACSDGLWHYFSERELAQILTALPPKDACETLIAQARQRAAGRGDNLSMVVVKFKPK